MSYDHSSEYESGDSINSSDSMNGSNSDSGSTGKKRKSSTPSSVPASAQHRCSYCGTVFDRAQSKHMPFCSKRCQMVDLGMWLTESYGLPHEGESSLDSYGVVEDE